ncbi:hypothetical protein BT93_K1007 [Corymbia citriodora subsp. variegata]|nr:hypothetical protein BT93_K1007 [Corymbia citriodora subsp. variegata]
MEEKSHVARIERGARKDDQANHILSLMNISDNDKRIIVIINGEGGIGKTTLAKLIYNQVSCHFDGCSFLANINEATQVLGGFQLLQTKLISDVLKRELEDVAFVSRGIEFFRDSFCNMRVLIILDDVENAFHVQKLIGDCFDCFASGSRILVTTRNSVVLEESPQIRTYYVSRLDNDQAFQLFRQHASLPTSSSCSNFELLNRHLKTMAGLPLFIEVMGALSNIKTPWEWSMLLQEFIIPKGDFQSIVEGGLDHEQKQRFLDIACFATGIDSRVAFYLWFDSTFLPSSEILTPLAKIGENNQIWMHSMLRRLGREIIRGENLTDPGRRSRILNHEIALDTIKRKQMQNLRVLDLTGCVDLLVTPKFSGCQNLAILILERCSQLVKIDHSIGDLKCLVSLNLMFCTELSMLPVEVGRLTALQELLMDGTSIQEIPISIGHLKQLETMTASNCFSLSQLPRTICHLTNISFLSLDGTRIAALPDSVGILVRLKHLSLRDCRRIRKLPNSIGNIGSSLVELNVSGTGISKFPDLLKNLQNLKVLRMDSCFFREFPPDIGELTNLEEIHASWCRSFEGGIPSEIGKLHNLRILRLRHSTISSIPAEIHELSNLRTLDLLHCDMIKDLPRLPSSITVLYVDDALKSSHLP